MENEELIFKKSISSLQRSGKKQKAYNLLRTLLLLTKKRRQKPLNYLFSTIEEISPVLDVTKLGSSSNKILDLPKVISLEQQYKLGIRWFFQPLVKKRGKTKTHFESLIKDFKKKRGYSFTKRNTLYESMISSRPFLFILKYKQK